MPKAKQTTALALPADRIAQVFTWILSGASEHEITDAISTTWPDAESMPLIVAAMQRIAKSADAESDVILGWCIESTRLVYQRAIEANDLATALRAIKQLHSLAV